MPNPKLQRTRNYAQFVFTKENREVNILKLKPEHKRLRDSMSRYGFLPSKPISVKVINGKFVVVDGQHRLTFAKEFGLEVFFVLEEMDVDVSHLNVTQANWSPKDYIHKWASSGNMDYIEASMFSSKNGIPLVLAFAMLAGTHCSGNITHKIKDGTYKIKTRDLAHRVMAIYAARAHG
jgi:hypothetical protein